MDQTADGLSNLEQAMGNLDTLTSRLAAVSDKEIQRALVDAMPPIVAKIKRDMIENFRKAPIRRRTGKLAQAMEALIVEPVFKGNAISISIRMPPNVAPYKSESGYETPFYTAAAAINYGALRQGKTRMLGQKAARTAKQGALGQPLSKRQRSSQARLGVVQDDNGLTIQGRKVSVIAPRPFFFLTEAQRKEAEDMLNDEVEFALIQLLGG